MQQMKSGTGKPAESYISVVVPVYNREKLVTRCLESIYAQDVRPLRIVVVDNNSSDGSLGQIRKWAVGHIGEAGLEIEVLEEKRPGAAQARQTGFCHTDTEWVYFFDSDDEMLPGTLKRGLAESKDADVVYWPLRVQTIDGRVFVKRFTAGGKSSLLRYHIFSGLFGTPAFMIRADALRKAGGWNPKIMVWDDWELGMRILLTAKRIRAVMEEGAMIYCQKESITGTSYSLKLGEWEKTVEEVRRQVNRRDDADLRRLGFPSKRRLGEMLDYRLVNLAALYAGEGLKNEGKKRLHEILAHTSASPLRKGLLKLIYFYTSHGGRGAYKLWF